VGENDSNLKEVTKYAGVNNTAGIQAMVGAGKAALVDKGTPITLIEHGGVLKDKEISGNWRNRLDSFRQCIENYS